MPLCMDRDRVPDPDIFFESDPDLLPEGYDPHGFQPQAFNSSPEDKSAFQRARTENEVRAQMVCLDCPLTAECLLLGMAEDEGVWGGFTAAERRILRDGGSVRKDPGPGGLRRQEALLLFASGLKIDQVADKMGVARESVMQHLRGHIVHSSDTAAFRLESEYVVNATGAGRVRDAA